MNEGGSTDTTAALDSSSLEKHQIVGSHQINASYYTPNGAVVSWSTQGENNSLRENGVLSNSGYNHEQVEPTLRNVQDGTNVAPNNSTSSSGTTNGVQGYSGYAAYPNTDPYGYSNTGYAAPYNQYQQQSNEYQQQSSQYQQPPSQYQQSSSQYQQPSNQYQLPSSQYQQPSSQYQQPSSQYQQPSNQYQQPFNQSYTHQVGAYQNTGAPYQPISSFPNTGSYAGPTSYSSTYYSPGDYQTSGSYTSGTYGTQPNLWHGGQYAAYSSQQYPNYTPDSNSAYSSTTAVAASQYQQHYKQWEDYYNKTQTEVSCAPGTEITSAPSASSVSCSVPSGSNEYAASNNQMPTAFTTSWGAASSSELSSVQPATESGSVSEGYWKHGSTVFQNDLPNTVQPHIQPPDVNPTYGSFQNQPNPSFSQGSIASYSASYQVSQHHQPSFQTFSQPPEHLDSRKGSKLQIPTNPRIASNLSVGVQKTDKDSSMTSTAVKPAYVGVSMQPNIKVTSQDDTDSMLKPGTFPKSLRGYVERALARCKDDRQKAASQDIMKEVITRATADGTLYTKDWDIEPLFPMPSIDAVKKDNLAFPIPHSAVPNIRKSPSRRAKSRWGPVPDETPINKYANIPIEAAKYGVWKKQFSGGKPDNKSLQTKSPLSDQKIISKNVGRPAKRQRLGNDPTAADDDEGSSDSDKEHSLTKYYAAAVALADSPEEKKRRESRSKRFDKGRGNRAENNYKAKHVGAGNSYARKAGALVATRTFEESGSRAVEDIDWDALKVRGTCQEIEKRYLRLTSAPDPATVRPEEVLEKALLMVQNSQKNYLYKCDQLKSIRQDLTVQHIRNELTVKVYETHARLAIESGDMPEYNQCQSQLKSLYAEGNSGCHMEFAAYNLLRVILHPNNNRDLLSAMSRLSAESKTDKAVVHALSVRTAVTSGNYVMFFRLYETAPNLNTFLMDLYVEKMRYAAVKCISRSYRPTVPVSYLSQILGFGSALPTSETSDEKEMDGIEECIEWLKAHGACFTSENSGEMLLDTKASASSLYMPEAEDAVPHGDANLAVNDFFTRNLVQAS